MTITFRHQCKLYRWSNSMMNAPRSKMGDEDWELTDWYVATEGSATNFSGLK